MLQIPDADHRALLRTTETAPNDQMHSGVFCLLAALNVAILALAWTIFSDSWEAKFMIVVCAFYVLMYFGTPYFMLRMGKVNLEDRMSWSRFLRSPFSTLTGTIKGWEAAVQVCLIPAAIVLALVGFWVIL